MKEELSNNLQKDYYECIICNCKIFSYTNFILHHKIHAIQIFFDDWKISYKQKNNCYKCNYCSKLISRKLNLLKHLTIHFNGEYHNCNNCERIFIGKDNLDIHLETKHQQNNDEVKNNHNNKQMLDQDSASSSSAVNVNKSKSFDDYNCRSSQITKSTNILSKKLTKKVVVSIKRSKKLDRIALEKKYKNVKHEFEPTSGKIRTKTIAKIINENDVNKTEKELCENYEEIKTSKKKSRKKLIVKLEVIDIDSKIKEHQIECELENLENYKYKSKNENEEITEEFNKNDTNIDTLKANIERKTVIVNAYFEKVNIQNINETQTLSSKNTDKIENDTENQILNNDNNDDVTQNLCNRNEKSMKIISNEKEQEIQNQINQILNDNDDNGTQNLCNRNEKSMEIISNEKEQEIQNQIYQILNDNDDDGTQNLCDRNEKSMEIISNEKEQEIQNQINQILNDNDDDDGTQNLCDRNEKSMEIISNEKEQEIQNQKTQIKNSLIVRNVEKINEMLIEKTNEICLENEIINDKNVMKSQISNNIQNFDESDKMNNETNHISKYLVNNNKKTDKKFNDYQNRTNKQQFGSNVIKFNYSIKNVENENSNMKSLENNQMKSNENININITESNLIDSSNIQNFSNNESAAKNSENDIVNKIFNFRKFSEKFQNVNQQNFDKQLKRKEITDLYCEENEIQLSEENLNQQKRIKVDNRNNHNQITVIKKANSPGISSTTTINSGEFSTKTNSSVISSTTTINSGEFSTAFSSLRNIIQELRKNNTNLSMEIGSMSVTPVINLIDDDDDDDGDDDDNSNTTSTCEMTMSIGNREKNTEIIDLTSDRDCEAENRNDLTSNIVYAAEKRIDLTSNVDHEPENITNLIPHTNVDYEVERKGVLQELENFLQSFENMLYTNNIPISLEDIIFLETYYYVKEISSYDFSEEQLKVIRLIRRRTRNAVKNYRKKNDSSISTTSNNNPQSNSNLFTISEKLNADTYQQQPPQQRAIHQQPLHQQPIHQQPLHQQPLHQQPLHQQPLHQQPIHQQPIHQQPLHQQPLHQQPPHQQRKLLPQQSSHQQRKLLPQQPSHQQPLHQQPLHYQPVDQQRQLLLQQPPHQQPLHQQPLDQQRQLLPESTWTPLNNIYPVTITFQHPQSGVEVMQQIPFTINPNYSSNSNSTTTLTQNHPVLTTELVTKFDPANKLAVFNNLSNLNTQNANEVNGEKYDIENRLMQIVLDPNQTISYEPSKTAEYYFLSPNLKIRMTP